MARTVISPPAVPPTDLAPLTDEAVAEQTDAGSFKRGRGYARSKRIFNAVRRVNLLRARCHGSSGGPYLVEVTLAKAGQAAKRNPLTYSCDCPRGGFCKHIVALLLTWIEAPESFTVRPPIAEAIADRSREDLVALIELILAEAPDLEALLDLPAPIAGAVGGEPIDEAAIRRQVEAALKDDEYGGYGNRGYGHNYGYDYGGYDEFAEDDRGSRAASKLSRLTDLANAYADAGHWRNVLTIYAVIVEGLEPRLSGFYNDDRLCAVLASANERLAAALDAQGGLPGNAQLSGDERTWLIDAIYRIWQTSLNAGSLSLGEDGPRAIARHATPAEQTELGRRLRGYLTARPGSPDVAWQKRSAIWFLSLLAGDAGLSDEDLLHEYREAELWEEAAEMLFKTHRVEEAISLAARRLTTAASLLPFADRLLATAEPLRIEQAISLVDDRLWEREGVNARDDQAMREWLTARFTEQGHPEKSLALTRDQFTIAPGKPAYDAIKRIALHPDQPGDPWPALRQEMVATLRKRGDWFGLIDIFLEEGEVAEALKALERAEKSGPAGRPTWSSGFPMATEPYALRVAAAAEADFPEASIHIYQQQAELKIAGRNREAYRVAAWQLAQVRKVLEANDRAEQWPPLIGELRQNHRNLPALRQELDALGLQ